MSVIPVHMVYSQLLISCGSRNAAMNSIILWYMLLLEVTLYHFRRSECVVLTYSIPGTIIYDEKRSKCNMMCLDYKVAHTDSCGLGSVVGIVTDYELDGPGIEPRWGRDFLHQSRPALGLTQPPVQWVPGLSGG
jgi:hypothetical protein